MIVMSQKKTVNVHYESKKSVITRNHTTDSRKIIWTFENVDKDGYFAFDVNRDDFQPLEIFDKMIFYSKMTWADIKKATHDNGKSKHHFLDMDKLSKQAKKRVAKKGLSENSDSIFSFALQNKLRVIGRRENEFFHVLWYDPNHEFCPSRNNKKKVTHL